jgi:hypothetical protein
VSSCTIVGQFKPRGAMSKYDMRYFMPKHCTEFSIGKIIEERPCKPDIIMASQVSNRCIRLWHGNVTHHHAVSETARLNNGHHRVRDTRVGDLGPHAFIVRSSFSAGVRRCGVCANYRDRAQREDCRSGGAKHELHYLRLPQIGVAVKDRLPARSAVFTVTMR